MNTRRRITRAHLLSLALTAAVFALVAATTAWAAEHSTSDGENAASAKITLAGDAADAQPNKGKPPAEPTAPPEPTPEPCTDCPAMYVSVVTARYLDIGKGKLRQICDVEVRDETGAQVVGAAVTAVMTNDWQATLTELTQEQYDNDYFARFGPRDFKARCGQGGIDEFSCTVSNVTHSEFTYTPSLNLEDSDTALCPQ